MTWFSIVKNRLLVKPKTQLRVQDIKEIDDDEPCKKKLREYYDYSLEQARTYGIKNDAEVQSIYNDYDLTIDDGSTSDKAISKHNKKFASLIVYDYGSVLIDSEEFSKMPERVACRMLGLIDSEEDYYEEIDGYFLSVSFGEDEEDDSITDDTLIWQSIGFRLEIAIDSSHQTVYDLAGGAFLHITTKDETIDFEKDMSARDFYNDIFEFLTNKLEPKNWK